MLNFAQAQARLGASITRCMANAVLRPTPGVEVAGRLIRQPADRLGLGIDVAATGVEFEAVTAEVPALDLVGLDVSTLHKGRIEWWRITSSNADQQLETTCFKLEAQRERA